MRWDTISNLEFLTTSSIKLINYSSEYISSAYWIWFTKIAKFNESMTLILEVINSLKQALKIVSVSKFWDFTFSLIRGPQFDIFLCGMLWSKIVDWN